MSKEMSNSRIPTRQIPAKLTSQSFDQSPKFGIMHLTIQRPSQNAHNNYAAVQISVRTRQDDEMSQSTVNGIVEEVVVAGERDCEDQAGEQGSPGKQCHQRRFFFWT